MPTSTVLYRPLLRRLEELLTSVTQEHGRATLADFLIRYEYLLTLLDIAAKDTMNAATLEGLIYHLTHEIQRAYGAMQADTQLPPWCFHEGVEPRLRFDATIFAERYAARAARLKSELINLDDSTVSELEELAPYVYILDLKGSVIVWPHPLTADQFVLARDPLADADPVTHPMLAPDALTVLCAGELILIKDHDGAPRTVVANTRSGHFRPPPQSARSLRKALTEHLAIPSPQSVIIFIAFSGGRRVDPFMDPTDARPNQLVAAAPSRTGGSPNGR